MVERIPFEQIKPIGNPAFRDLADSLLSGYKAGAYPAEQRQKYRGEEENILKTALANEFEKKYGNKKREAEIKNILSQALYHNAGANKLRMDYDPQAYLDYARGLTGGLIPEKSNTTNATNPDGSEVEPNVKINAPGTESALTFENYVTMTPEARKSMYESPQVSLETKKKIEEYEKNLNDPQYGQVMQGLNSAVQSPDNISAVKLTPQQEMLNSLIKHKLNLPESKEEKRKAALEDFEEKEKIKRKIETKEGTTSFLTQKQVSQNAAKKAIDPIIDLIKLNKESGLGGYLTPSQKKKYNTTAFQSGDSYLKAQNLPNTQEALKESTELFKQGFFESKQSYNERLEGYLMKMAEESGVPVKKVKHKIYISQNGKWHEI